MKDRNIVMLSGIVGDDVKFGRSQNGKNYCSFSLCINSYMRDMADDTERANSQAMIRVTAFDKKLVEYLQNVGIKRGQRASIFGRLSTHKTEYKGIDYIQLAVVIRDIEIVKPNIKEQ